MGRGKKQRGQGQGRKRQSAVIVLEVLHPMAPADLRPVVPAHLTEEEIQREFNELLGPPPPPDTRWHWRCLSPSGPVKTRLLTRPTRTPFRERR